MRKLRSLFDPEKPASVQDQKRGGLSKFVPASVIDPRVPQMLEEIPWSIFNATQIP